MAAPAAGQSAATLGAFLGNLLGATSESLGDACDAGVLEARRGTRDCLSQYQLAISVRRHRLAALAKGGVAAAVTHDPADLLSLDIAVDAGL
jgi:hypothetical protein